jgi:hypothetical protein
MSCMTVSQAIRLAVAGACLLAAASGFAQKKTATTSLPPPSNGNEIMPPFSLVWHEPSERLEGKVEAAKLVVEDRRKVGNRWAIIVSGFKKPNPSDPNAPKPPELRRVMFYFVDGDLTNDKGRDGRFRDRLAGGQLVEVELQYEQPGWDEDQYGVCLGEKRQMLERLYGQGQQLVRTTTPTPDGQASQTLVGYKWNKNNTAVELIYFHVVAKSNAQQFHTLSLHYKRS